MYRIATTIAFTLGLGGCTTDQSNTKKNKEVETEVEEEGPTQLLSLTELMESLEGGGDVTATLYYGDCEMYGEPSGIDAVGGMKVDTYEWFAEGVVGNEYDYVAFSKSSLVLIYGEHVYDYVKVRVYDNGYVQIVAEYLDVDTYEVEMYEEFDCELDQGDGGSVSLWSY